MPPSQTGAPQKALQVGVSQAAAAALTPPPTGSLQRGAAALMPCHPLRLLAPSCRQVSGWSGVRVVGVGCEQWWP